MAPHSSAYDNNVLDALYGAGHAASMPDDLYAAVYIAAPSKEGGGTEADYEEYARVLVPNDATMFDDAVDGEKPTLLQIDFPTPWGSVFQGVWASGTAYVLGDVVAYGDDRYEALGATTGDQPDTSPADWVALVPPNPIVAFAFHDHITNDSIVSFEELSDPIQVMAGEPLYIPAGGAVFTPPLE